MRKSPVLICVVLALFGALQGCSPAGPPPDALTETAAVQDARQAQAKTETAMAEIPTDTPVPDTATPTETEIPSATPTETEVPSATPTNTEIPDTPTSTSMPPTQPPAPQPTADTGGSGSSDGAGATSQGGTISCNQQTGGTVKIRIENKTNGPVGLYFYGEENYACSISGGVARIYVKSGRYSLTASMCGSNINLGSVAVKPTFYYVLTCP
jgi:hypothetical protein